MSTRKILVIDDSKVIRMHVKDMLPAGNFDVLEAKDGLEGYNMLRTEQPQLIMLDFLLPRMSGWEVYQEIQKDDQLKVIPLVMMSGRKEEVVEKIPEPFEHFAFIEKPFDQKQLVAAIKEAMSKAKEVQKQVGVSAAAPTTLTRFDTAAMTAEIQYLNNKIAKMQAEIDSLKAQLSQLITFVKKKLT